MIDEQVGIEENEESRFYEKVRYMTHPVEYSLIEYIICQVKEYHQTTENAEQHFQNFVVRTSNYEVLKVCCISMAATI